VCDLQVLENVTVLSLAAETVEDLVEDFGALGVVSLAQL